MKQMLELIHCKRTERLLIENMSVHYSQPKGFVGRNICYGVFFNNVFYGNIVGGSATLYLPNRNEYLGVDQRNLTRICNNIFFHLERNSGSYPFRNFTTEVLYLFEKQICIDWKAKYGDQLTGLEALVELPRTGEVYKRADWTLIGKTIGYTCKRSAGKGSDSWTGKRIWEKTIKKPKLVFAKKLNNNSQN